MEFHRTSLVVKNVTVEAGGREVVRNVSLQVNPGEIHALVGPNGSGKSSLAYALFGHPEYRVISGTIQIRDVDIGSMPPEARAEKGLFLSFQEPPEIGGVTLKGFLDAIGNFPDAAAAGERFNLGNAFFSRFLNEGFSGGEKKKSEIVQLVARRPHFAVLDEIDTGLDADAVGRLPAILREWALAGTGFLVITHGTKFLHELAPDRVSVMSEGAIVMEGRGDILAKIEAGFHELISEVRSA